MSYVAAEARQAGSVLTVAHLAFGAAREGSHEIAPLARMPAVLSEPAHTPADIQPFMPEFFREKLQLRWAREAPLLVGW